MAFEREPDDDTDALLRQLGSDNASNTMPVGGAAPTTSTPPATPPPATTAPSPSPTQPSVFQGFTPKHAMEGFAYDREQNTGKSAKDAFASLSNQAPPPPIHDKAALGQWFDQYIAPGMNQLGHKVSGPAQGDKFGFENWQGKFDVDFGRGAGADGGALAWQVDEGTAQMPENATYTPQSPNITTPLAAGNNTPTATDQIQAEIDAIINERGSPLDEQAMLDLLQQGLT